jgi:glycosyltransferase involved in cell wall biosynthesis
MPRVSVIVAARDAAATLRATLDSVVAQTFTDWELIVVDDGSVDRTGDIARACPAAAVIRQETATGPAAARNHGVGQAQGELLAMLDADDFYRPDYLEKQVACFDEQVLGRRRVGIVGCDAGFCDALGRPLPGRWSERVAQPQHIGVTEMLRENPLHSKVLLSRQAFEDAQGFAPELRRAEDYDLWLRIAELGYEVAVTPEPLVVLRLRPDSLSAQSDQLADATATVYSRALDRGKLDVAQRRIARRQRRLQCLVAARAQAATTSTSPAQRARVGALSALVALEHPERWRAWLRRGVRTAGPSRHA